MGYGHEIDFCDECETQCWHIVVANTVNACPPPVTPYIPGALPGPLENLVMSAKESTHATLEVFNSSGIGRPCALNSISYVLSWGVAGTVKDAVHVIGYEVTLIGRGFVKASSNWQCSRKDIIGTLVRPRQSSCTRHLSDRPQFSVIYVLEQ